MKSVFCQTEEILNAVNALEPSTNKKYNGKDDVSNGRIFADVFKDVARFNSNARKWYVYTGKVWKEDQESLIVEDLAKKLYHALVINALKSDADNTYRNYVQKLGSRGKRDIMLKDARSYYPVSSDQFDTNKELLNCQNGTFNLTTGELLLHSPDHMISKISNIIYNPEAKSSLWEKFVSDIMCDNPEMIAFLQQCLGYSISPSTFLECFFVTYGETSRNGKGTLNTVIQKMLGDYAGTASPDAFTSKKYKSSSDQANDAIASLVGTNYVSVSEPEERMVLDSALVKALTGNDKLRVRKLYESGFEYTASFKIWFNTNYLPQITDETVFQSGRVILIPFERHFSESEQDKRMKEKLTHDYIISAVFNWCYQGYLEVMKNDNLEMPESVKEAVRKYAITQDRIGEFLDECTVESPEGKERFSRTYDAYKRFCINSNYHPFAKSKFKEKLQKKLEITEYNHQAYVIGIAFAEDCPFIET